MPAGRPTAMTPEALLKLEQAFKIGSTDREACAHAKIACSTLYEYQKENPEYAEQKAQWKEKPILLARFSVVEGLQSDPHLALKYLERKKKDEFSLRTETEYKEVSEFSGDDYILEQYKEALMNNADD